MSALWRVLAIYLLCVSTASAGLFGVLNKSDVTCDMKDDSKFGLVVLSGSLPDSNTPYGAPVSVSYVFSSPSSPLMGMSMQIQRGSLFKKPRSDFAGEYGELLVFRVKPGDYSLDTWNYRDLGANDHKPSETLKKIPFQVAAGRVTYLGSFKPKLISGRNMLGTSLVSIWPTSVDNSQRDLSLLFQTCPQLDIMQVDMSPLDLGPWQ